MSSADASLGWFGASQDAKEIGVVARGRSHSERGAKQEERGARGEGCSGGGLPAGSLTVLSLWRNKRVITAVHSPVEIADPPATNRYSGQRPCKYGTMERCATKRAPFAGASATHPPPWPCPPPAASSTPTQASVQPVAGCRSGLTYRLPAASCMSLFAS